MEYKVVSENRLEKLEEQVNALINQGWKPQGGICFGLIGLSPPPSTGSSYKTYDQLYQAMVK